MSRDGAPRGRKTDFTIARPPRPPEVRGFEPPRFSEDDALATDELRRLEQERRFEAALQDQIRTVREIGDALRAATATLLANQAEQNREAIDRIAALAGERAALEGQLGEQLRRNDALRAQMEEQSRAFEALQDQRTAELRRLAALSRARDELSARLVQQRAQLTAARRTIADLEAAAASLRDSGADTGSEDEMSRVPKEGEKDRE